MKLICPCEQYKDQFLAMIEAFADEGTTGFWLHLGGNDPFSFEQFLETDRLYAQGKSLTDGWVPATTYWLIDDDQLVGHTNIRHELTEGWIKCGGNIGYHISPFHRRKGYGTQILSLALEKCRDLGMQKALVTCDEGNIGSEKVIENNGGVLENVVEQDPGKPNLKRYWITL